MLTDILIVTIFGALACLWGLWRERAHNRRILTARGYCSDCPAGLLCHTACDANRQIWEGEYTTCSCGRPITDPEALRLGVCLYCDCGVEP